MKINNTHFLTYCTNIHPGEHWHEVFDSLKQYTLPIKQRLSPNEPFGIGLRLSDIASKELFTAGRLTEFKDWLACTDMYVFSLNGFPYGGFHRQAIKELVHRPDWTTKARLDYTLRLFNILEELLPEGMDGGISTSPLSYKFWHSNSPQQMTHVYQQSCRQLVEVAFYLDEIYQRSGKLLHLDIEPEPDGMLENRAEVLAFYENHLIPIGNQYAQAHFIKKNEAIEDILKRHIQICYDVCHFAVEYEEPAEVIRQWEAANIRIGKIQISAAIGVELPRGAAERKAIKKAFLPFNESTYLHQVVAQKQNGDLVKYRDLSDALADINKPELKRWRTHFHVPIFMKNFGLLDSTQDEILKVLDLLKQKQITNHLEVETYTWEVLPEGLRQDLTESISRELEWVVERLGE